MLQLYHASPTLTKHEGAGWVVMALELPGVEMMW
jgi:hypothetical protein